MKTFRTILLTFVLAVVLSNVVGCSSRTRLTIEHVGGLGKDIVQNETTEKTTSITSRPPRD